MGHDDGTASDDLARLTEKHERGLASTSDAVGLALLLLEPHHRELEAVDVLDAAHTRDPDDPEAALWLAHTLHHEVMTTSALQRSAALLRPLTERGRPWVGAALLLLAGVLDDLEAGPGTESRLLLERSVSAEPGWVNNHESLAWALAAVGLVERARDELAAARGNVASGAPADLRSARFEQLITGRAGHDAAGRLDRVRRRCLQDTP